MRNMKFVIYAAPLTVHALTYHNMEELLLSEWEKTLQCLSYL